MMGFGIGIYELGRFSSRPDGNKCLVLKKTKLVRYQMSGSIGYTKKTKTD